MTNLADTAFDAIPCLAPEVSCFCLRAAAAELAFIMTYPAPCLAQCEALNFNMTQCSSLSENKSDLVFSP